MANTIEKMPYDLEEPCLACQGCIQCEDTYCLFNAQGNPEECHKGMCMYCTTFLTKQRLFLNNVG